MRQNPDLLGSANLRSSLETVFNAHHAHVFGFLLARCRSREVAADIAGETFVEAARAVKLGRSSTVTEAWLIHVARLRLIDHWRRQGREKRRVERLVRLSAPADFVVVPDDGPDPSVGSALDALPANQRAALMLRYLDDHSVSEVADALELTYPATESLLARARRSFARAYKESEPS